VDVRCLASLHLACALFALESHLFTKANTISAMPNLRGAFSVTIEFSFEFVERALGKDSTLYQFAAG
jgi:hypothetical protein